MLKHITLPTASVEFPIVLIPPFEVCLIFQRYASDLLTIFLEYSGIFLAAQFLFSLVLCGIFTTFPIHHILECFTLTFCKLSVLKYASCGALVMDEKSYYVFAKCSWLPDLEQFDCCVSEVLGNLPDNCRFESLAFWMLECQSRRSVHPSPAFVHDHQCTLLMSLGCLQFLPNG